MKRKRTARRVRKWGELAAGPVVMVRAQPPGTVGGTGGNYDAKAVALGSQLKPGEVRVVEVRHDGWCGVFDQRPCDCDPEATLGPELAGNEGD